MLKSKLKNSLLNFLLLIVSIFLTFLLISFLLIKISSQNIFPRSLAAHLPNTLLTFYPDTYNKKNLNNFTAVLGNSVAQGNGDAYLSGENNYSISHNLHDSIKKNYLIFGRAGLHSIKSVTNLIKIHKLTNNSFMIKNLNKPDSIIFYFYEGIDLVWNYDLFTKESRKNESVKNYTERLIKRDSSPTFLEKLYNFLPILPFAGAFLEDFKNLFNDIYASKNLKESFSVVFDRIKKILGFYIVLSDREKNNLTWTNSLKDHKNVKNIRPIQGASETLNKDQILIALQVFYESVRHAKSWSNTKNVTIIYISAPISIYNWNEPVIYERQSLVPKSKNEVKSITNYENKTKNIFIRQEIRKFSEKNNITFLDPTDILIEKGKNEVLHGPLDWGHLNYHGYKIVSDFILEN